MNENLKEKLQDNASNHVYFEKGLDNMHKKRAGPKILTLSTNFVNPSSGVQAPCENSVYGHICIVLLHSTRETCHTELSWSFQANNSR